MDTFASVYTPPALAARSKRFAGQLLDSLIASAFVFVAVLLSSAVHSAGWVFLLVSFVCYLAYILLADGLNGGQSLGKRLLGIRVVDSETGEPCTYGQSCVRNIFYILGVFDWVFIFGDRRQRLGDKAAGTLVVYA